MSLRELCPEAFDALNGIDEREIQKPEAERNWKAVKKFKYELAQDYTYDRDIYNAIINWIQTQ